MVKVRINGRQFLLGWSEFEKALATQGVTTAVEILEVA